MRSFNLNFLLDTDVGEMANMLAMSPLLNRSFIKQHICICLLYTSEIGANYSLNDKHSLGFRYTLTSRPNTKSDVFTSNDITANNQFYDHLENQEYSSTSGKPTHQLNVYYNGTVGDLNIDFNTDYYTNTSTGKGLYHEVSQEQAVSYTHLWRRTDA